MNQWCLTEFCSIVVLIVQVSRLTFEVLRVAMHSVVMNEGELCVCLLTVCEVSNTVTIFYAVVLELSTNTCHVLVRKFAMYGRR